ncbi:putative homoserine dehydrogenase-like protein [Paenibacillus sp. V4I3]|uniref:NAD(P)-dependent oxidoreductase n=1 Tax=Paenibacillus sp. V4I3 TaxID=3042305 RepID=UPI0027832F3F|nr:NAD(P)-dependent oxidoreductase [Paenibacillus sp. V4I3]MDQ0873223.1 putative homoserine dehydrogenase-like protein [Paenibacillus sp. V4I3]
MEQKSRIGVIGTGFISKGLVIEIEKAYGLKVSRVLTRRNIDHCGEYPLNDRLTNSVDELIEHSDVIVECCGDTIYGTETILRIMEASIPVITINADLQVTTGSYLASKGFITEAEGDQPGCLAALRENVLSMGFKPLVYGNIKGFLNLNPSKEDMLYWAKKQGLNLGLQVSFTDGTKVQIEQALVANGLGARAAVPGLLGTACEDVRTGANIQAEYAKGLGYPISDYILSPKSPAGVFIAAEHDDRHKDYLRYLKLGDGPFYTLYTTFHLCHLEVVKTIRRVLGGGGVLLNNSTNPAVSIASIAKRRLVPGEVIERGVGSFEVRGIAVNMEDHLNHVPIGLLTNAVVRQTVEEGQMLTFRDVDIPDSIALSSWKEMEQNRRKEAFDLSAS